MSVGQQIEFEYSRGDGHTWVIRCNRDRPMDAVDAVFRWFREVDEFGARHLGVILSAILTDAVKRGRAAPACVYMTQQLFTSIPAMAIEQETRLNLMREIVRVALDSTA